MPRRYRRSTTKRYRRKAPARKKVRGIKFISYRNNPYGLLRLQGSKGPEYIQRRITRSLYREHQRSNNPNLFQLARSGLGVIGRHARAVGHFSNRFVPVIGGLIGDGINAGLQYAGSLITDDAYTSDNKVINAGLSFLDGIDRPGSINKYTDKLGKVLLDHGDLISSTIDKVIPAVSSLVDDAYWEANKYGIDVAGKAFNLLKPNTATSSPFYGDEHRYRTYSSYSGDAATITEPVVQPRQVNIAHHMRDVLRSNKYDDITGRYISSNGLTLSPMKNTRRNHIPYNLQPLYLNPGGREIPIPDLIDFHDERPSYYPARRSMITAASPGNRGGMIITHKEYLRDIKPSAIFTKYEFPLNPGQAQTFPWLSQMADSYDEYEIKALVFEYKSTCSDTIINANNNMGLGSVTMATNYNATREPFYDKRTMENHEGASSRKPSTSNVHVVDVKKSTLPAGGRKWIRTGDTIPNEDIRLYDVGVFNLATFGQQAVADGVMGELWVAYQVEFFKPKYIGAAGTNLLTDHYTVKNPAMNQQAPFGGSNVTLIPSGVSRINTFITTNGFSNQRCRVNFRARHQGMTFMFLYTIKGQVGANRAQMLMTGNNNILPETAFSNNGTYDASTDGTATTSIIMFAQRINVLPHPDGPWYIDYQLSSAVYPDGAPDFFIDVWIMQINASPEPGIV